MLPWTHPNLCPYLAFVHMSNIGVSFCLFYHLVYYWLRQCHAVTVIIIFWHILLAKLQLHNFNHVSMGLCKTVMFGKLLIKCPLAWTWTWISEEVLYHLKRQEVEEWSWYIHPWSMHAWYCSASLVIGIIIILLCLMIFILCYKVWFLSLACLAVGGMTEVHSM